MCRALRSAAYFHVCKALLRCVVFCSLTYLHSSPALPNLQFASFGWTVARVPHAPAFAMGRAQRQLRESQRPGQQNRVETPASDETVEVEVEVETDGEEPRRESASGSRNDMGGSRNDMGGTTTQLSPSELRILDYMVWNTHKPPPKTVFLRPYIEAVRNASGSRPPLTAVGQDERLEEWTVPIDPRGRSPLPRRRRAPQATSTRLAPTPKYRTGTTTSSTSLPSRQQPSMQKDSKASMPQAQEETPAPTSGLSAARRQTGRTSCLQSRSRRSVRFVPPTVKMSRVLSSFTR